MNSLSQADYVVCTFTSNICRYVYEMMQSKESDQIDASLRIKSLDHHYFVSSFNVFTKLAIMDHEAENKSNEIELKKGDIIAVHAVENANLLETSINLWNGYMKGINQRTNKKGIFPSYKVSEYYTNAIYFK